MHKHLLLISAVIFYVCLLSSPVIGQRFHQFSAYASTAPVIDGQITAGEWTAADSVTVQLAPGGISYVLSISIMNDVLNLYFLATVKGPPSFSGGSVVTFWFDNTNKGYRASGDDWLSMNRNWGFVDGFWNAATSNNPPDSDYGGTNDGSVGISFSGDTETFELSHPLCSSDHDHDFCVHAGSILGVFVSLSVGPNQISYWPNYGVFSTILIASPSQLITVTSTQSNSASIGSTLIQSITSATESGTRSNLPFLILMLTLAVFILIPAYAIQSSRRRKKSSVT